MKLLIITQKVDIDDPILGFFHRWIEEFSKYCEKLTVIALGVGEYKLPENVKVLSLGKEIGVSKLKYIFNFYKYIWQERKNYDAVFVHMNPEYIVLGGLLWKILRKKMALWYAHKSLDLKLKISEKLTNWIFTPSLESCRLNSKKIIITGHGIDVGEFNLSLRQTSKKFEIIYVGRISQIKNQKLLIETINYLVKEKGVKNFIVKLIGVPVYEVDKNYFKGLEALVDNLELNEYVQFVGGVSNREIVEYYKKADLSVNLCPTGGLDKAVLESMSCGVPVVVSNRTFLSLLGENNKFLFLSDLDSVKLGDKIMNIMGLSIDERTKLGKQLREIVVQKHNLENLIRKIFLLLK